MQLGDDSWTCPLAAGKTYILLLGTADFCERDRYASFFNVADRRDAGVCRTGATRESGNIRCERFLKSVEGAVVVFGCKLHAKRRKA